VTSDFCRWFSVQGNYYAFAQALNDVTAKIKKLACRLALFPLFPLRSTMRILYPQVIGNKPNGSAVGNRTGSIGYSSVI